VDTERDLLFGVVAFQSGAIDADYLAETCANWVADSKVPLAEMLMDRGRMTDEQRTEVERAVARELESHGGNPKATLAAAMDGRTLEIIGDSAAAKVALEFAVAPPAAKTPHEGDLKIVGEISPAAHESRDRYTVTHLHAKGGMGRVWLARDSSLGRQIALKDLRPDQVDNSILCSRFLYEAKITAQLEHPGIVPVYEVGQGEVPYYTMRFVKGRTLSEAIRAYHKQRAAGLADSVDLLALLSSFVGVCHAVAYAHSRGVIHRDLKGQNVVLGDFGEAIVLDWGLAKRVGPDHSSGDGDVERDAPAAADDSPACPGAAGPDLSPGVRNGETTLPPESESTDPGTAGLTSHGSARLSASDNGSMETIDLGSLPLPSPSPLESAGRKPASRESGAGPDGTRHGQLLGTPPYMAPEQARGEHDRVDQRSDIYALGAILYELLTGVPPFVAPKTAEIIRKVCHEAPIPPRELVPQIGPALQAVCLKAMSKDPTGRYATATELAQDVQRYVADEPVNAYREPWTGKLLRWARRHKVAVSTAAGLLATASVALAVSTFLIARERNEAEAQGKQARAAVHMLTEVADIGFDEQLDPLQKKFLEKALAYYEKFTSRAAGDSAVKLEHGRACQQMGDIERKLGRLADSEKSYHRALDLLEPLAAGSGAGHDVKQSLARTRTLLGDLLVRRGGDTDGATDLYRLALAAQRALADPQKDPAATPEDRLRLGQSLRSQADLLRLEGGFRKAVSVYDEAVAQLELAHTVLAANPEIRTEWALAVDRRGWVHRELGDMAAAERDFRQALDLLDRLVAEFPTIPRHREVLAKACNSLGVLEKDTGRMGDAEVHLRRQVPLARRLAEDFPDRPEYRSILGRALTNLGTVLFQVGRGADALPVLREAIDLNAAISAGSPDDAQVKFYLAISHHDLGEALMRQGDTTAAIASYKKAQAINEAMVRQNPNQPRYQSDLASNLDSLAWAMNAAGQPRAAATAGDATAIYDRLIATYPDNVDYRIRQAVCLRNQGVVLAGQDHPVQAEAIYRRALAVLDAAPQRLRTADWQRRSAEVLSNLGVLHRAGAEDAFRRSIAISQDLLAGKPTAAEDRHNLAIAHNNLAGLLLELKRLPEAGPYFDQSLANFEKLVGAAPQSVELHSQFGTVLAEKGKWLDQSGKLADAKLALTSAIDHQRQAMRLGKNPPSCRLALAGHYGALAEVNRKMGSYDEAARLALEVPKTAPLSSRASACYDAAQILARLIAQLAADEKISQADRDRQTRKQLSRTVVLLREAIDSSPELAAQIKADRDIKALETRPQFQSLMSNLVDAGK